MRVVFLVAKAGYPSWLVATAGSGSDLSLPPCSAPPTVGAGPFTWLSEPPPTIAATMKTAARTRAPATSFSGSGIRLERCGFGGFGAFGGFGGLGALAAFASFFPSASFGAGASALIGVSLFATPQSYRRKTGWLVR